MKPHPHPQLLHVLLLLRRGLIDHAVDPEKKKYFRILPNHVAPTGAKYSKEGVKRGREQEKVSIMSFICLLLAILIREIGFERLEFAGCIFLFEVRRPAEVQDQYLIASMYISIEKLIHSTAQSYSPRPFPPLPPI